MMGILDMQLLWRHLKPLVLGKLLFAPDTPFTRQLMAQVRVCVCVWGGSLVPPSAQGMRARPERRMEQRGGERSGQGFSVRRWVVNG